MLLQNINDDLKSRIADYCYRTRRQYPNTQESLREIVYLMLQLGYIDKQEIDILT